MRERCAMRQALRWAASVLALATLAAAWVAWRNFGGEAPVQPRPEGAAGRLPASLAGPDTLARGEALALAGNCLGCHTRRGGEPGAGGRAIATPFGTVYSSNLTPDADTGLGRWSVSEFRRALHHGRSRDGRLLTPAFPYPNFTLVTDDDADAIYAWLMSRPAVAAPNRPHELRFPYRLKAALAVWRALYFRPGRFEPDPARPASLNRGRYLVEGLGHCGACHAARNFLGAPQGGTAGTGSEAGGEGGGIVSTQHWYAPSLHSVHEAGVADWPEADVVALLKTGTSPRGSVMGPMAEVVYRSTQFIAEDDARAMAGYLRSLSTTSATSLAAPNTPPAVAAPATPAVMQRGAAVYDEHCAGCHGRQGEGSPGIPLLAGNRAVRMKTPHNVIQAIRHGGFAPATAGNPRPFGMPPFRGLLGDDDIAAVASYVRGSWGNAAGAVQPLDVLRLR